MKRSILAILPICLATSYVAEATVTITFNFTADPAEPSEMTLSAANQNLFTDAGNFWSSKLTGYLDGTNRTVTIKATGFSEAASAGGGVTLGSAGPDIFTLYNFGGKDYIIAETGNASFNTHPDAVGAAGLLDAAVVRHEVGHILGLGTLWVDNDVYTDGTGQYTGVNGLQAFNQEFGQSAAFVPIELQGGSGTADGHLNEDNTPNLIVQSGINAGQNMDDALMTGNLSGSAFLSDTALGMYRDIGFTTVGYNSVPEPSSTLLLGLGSFALVMRRRK